MNPTNAGAGAEKPACTVLLIKGQGIGPECIEASRKVLAATGVPITYIEGSLGDPDPGELLAVLKASEPEVYAGQFGAEDPAAAAARLESAAKEEAIAGGNINDFYKKFLARLQPNVVSAIKKITRDLEKQTLRDAARASAVLKGALRTLDQGDEPSRNVTIRKAFEQYANIRRCVTLDPIAPGMKGADILFVRENVEDLYASIEHRLARNYPQALRHQTPEGCELICRAAFEVALRDGRRKVTALEKPNILKITGGLFKDTFLAVARDYNKDKLGPRAIEASFMIIDDGLAAIAAAPEKFDVVVTTNMFGDIGSDIAAKVTGGVGLVSSNNINPANPKAVSMFEAMGGTADDIAGQNKANPVALIDASAEMLLHIGGRDNILAAELIKTAVLEVLADGYYVGDIRKGPYQEARGREKIGTQEFAGEICRKIMSLRAARELNPEKTIKQIALDRAEDEVKPLFSRVLRSYEQYALDMEPGGADWFDYMRRNLPPNPVRAQSRIVGFDMFVDDSGIRTSFSADGSVDRAASALDPAISRAFRNSTGLDLSAIFEEGAAGSLQALRSFGQFSARVLRAYMTRYPDKAASTFSDVLAEVSLGQGFAAWFSGAIRSQTFEKALHELEQFDAQSLLLVQCFYVVRAREIEPVLNAHGFKLARITSRGTEIYPTMCDFEKRAVDRFRVEIDPDGPLASDPWNHAAIQDQIMRVQSAIVKKGWIVSETMLNRSFTDGEGDKKGKEMSGVSLPYAKALGSPYDTLAV